LVSSNAVNVDPWEVIVGLWVGIDEVESAGYYMIYPNPAKTVVNINSSTELRTVTIFNQVGQVVYNQDVQGNAIQVNTSDLQKGIYFVKLNSVAGEVTQKLIIQ
jgi:hypothetical protein